MRYVALLRGIGPLNPNMRNEKLRGVLENLGMENVTSVITTGNLIFDTESQDVADLEERIEGAWPAELGFTSTTIVRTCDEFLRMVDSNPFGDINDVPTSRLEATFLKHASEVDERFPYTPDAGGYTILGVGDRVIFSVVDTTTPRPPDIMRRIEGLFGKEITTRAWTTVLRIAKRME